MVQQTQTQRGGFNAVVRNSIGFSKTYNFILWFIFAGALLGCKYHAYSSTVILVNTTKVSLARFMYLNFNGVLCPSSGPSGGNSAAPGECYWYTNFTWYKVGIILHLAGILPASLLAVLQFTPVIRHRAIIFHRVSGWLAMLLWIVSTVGALMLARRAFNGSLETQAWVGSVGFGSTVCFVLAVWNIKRLQIEQHRAWMLRGWFYVRHRCLGFCAVRYRVTNKR